MPKCISLPLKKGLGPALKINQNSLLDDQKTKWAIFIETYDYTYITSKILINNTISYHQTSMEP